MNYAASVALLCISFLSYFLPWYTETSQIWQEDFRRKVYISLFNAWVPEYGYERGIRMPLTDYLAKGCPNILVKSECFGTVQKSKFATYGYIPLKVLS